LEVQEEELHIFGTHGEKERTILTARLFGSEVELIKEPRNAIDLTPYLDDLRLRVRRAIEARLADRMSGPPPASGPMH
jgi:hypothetical protein